MTLPGGPAPPPSSRLFGRRGGALALVAVVSLLLYVARDSLPVDAPIHTADGKTLAPGSPAYKAALAAAVAGCPSHQAAPQSSPEVKVVEKIVTQEKIVEKEKACPAPPSPAACPAAPSCAACPAANSNCASSSSSSAVGGPAFGVDAPFAQDGETKYLILQSPDYGRYSNNKMTFSEAAGIAAFTGRTLIAPPYRQCESGQTPSKLYNLGAMAAGSARWPGVQVVEDSNINLPALCGDSVMYVWYNSITRDLVPNPGLAKELEWRGIKWPVKMSSFLPLDESTVPEGVKQYVKTDNPGIESLAEVEPYASHFPAHYVRRDLKSFLTDNLFPYKVKALPQRCVVVQTLYLNVNWAVIPGMFQRVAANTWPSPTLETQVAAWFHANGVPQHKAVGIHMRLTDLATGLPFGFAHNCEKDPAFVVDALKQLTASISGADKLPLLVASDQFSSNCASAVLKAFPNHKKVESGGALHGCDETAFIQEVLGRTAGFVGNSLSSFTVSIHWARTARYGHPTNTSVFPEGGPIPPGQ